MSSPRVRAEVTERKLTSREALAFLLLSSTSPLCHLGLYFITIMAHLEDSLRQALAPFHEKLDSLDKKLDGFHEKVDGLHERLDGLHERLDGLHEKQTGYHEKLDGLYEMLNAVYNFLTPAGSYLTASDRITLQLTLD